MTSVIRLLETALYVADLDQSCDFYERVLGLGPDIATTAEKESQQRFRPLQIPGGHPEVRSRHTTAMDGFIWRSPSPPVNSTLGENACNRTAWQSKARWNGRAAGPASTFAIPTIT
jgi:catechol 2,3-dioxygenase-like lactoylglutathione lyase family enzyme